MVLLAVHRTSPFHIAGEYPADVIVVCGEIAEWGLPRLRGADLSAVARAAARDGSPVQLITIVPDGPDGDARLHGLAASGVGHVAVLRTAARSLEPADVDLALGYLPDTHVVIAIGLAGPVLQVALERAAWAAAAAIVVEAASKATPGNRAAAPGETANIPGADGAVVLQAPPSDPDGTFAGFVGSFAARIDAGATSADAWAATTRALAVDAIGR
ncbi:MAG: hypothetical protein ABIV26_03790 [Candidatus Limnocylindrales bacterium]